MMLPLKLFISVLVAFSFVSFQVLSAAAQPYKTLVAPINKHTTTIASLYTITLNFHQHYVIDLNAPFSWFHCSRPHPPVSFTSPQCTQARSYLSPSCPTNNNNKTCFVTPINPITKSCFLSQLTYNNLIISWTDGRSPKVPINFNHLYLSCAPTSLFQSLPRGVLGVAGLSLSPLSFSSQFSSPSLGISKKFAICLPSTTSAPGVVFFGDGPYYLLPPTNLDGANLISYTPLLKNQKSPDYYIGVNTISINGKSINPISTKLVVKLSTVVPYTMLSSHVYKYFFKSFSKATKGIPRVKRVEPFDLCFNASALGFTRLGFPVPQIDLELENGKNWTVFGANSMKQIGNGDVVCLAFVDGGKMDDEAATVVIGSYQMEDNLLVFDVGKSRLGFSSSLFFARTSCGNFNFTTMT